MLSSLARPAVRCALRPRRVLNGHNSVLLRGFASADKWGVTNDRITARVVNIVEDGGGMRTDVPLAKPSRRHEAKALFDSKKRFFELKKANKKASKQQKPKPDKEVVVGAKIAPNDLNMKVEQLKRFLNKGHKVKLTIKFAHAYHLKTQCLEQLGNIGDRIDAETGVPVGQPREQFGGVYMYYSPAN
ncbi:hypothetical protein PInf_007077 [Phytophthora infestans]|nr:hypothetical protein PInf_007077 [Phytophthora infestans]